MFNGNGLPLNYDKMPKCIYTHPEVASIGYNKESAEAKNIKTKSFKVSFNAIGKAVIEETTNDRGFCEMIINDETNEIIGINMIGPQVTELINSLFIAIYEWFSN